MAAVSEDDSPWPLPFRFVLITTPHACGGSRGSPAIRTRPAALCPCVGLRRRVALGGGGARLNPVETVWQYMRDNWLSNRVFSSYPDILDHCCEAWNRLVDQPWTIMSIGLRQWAYRF